MVDFWGVSFGEFVCICIYVGVCINVESFVLISIYILKGYLGLVMVCVWRIYGVNEWYEKE